MIRRGDAWKRQYSPTPFSENVIDVGPKPFQRPLLISLSFSSPVFSSTTVVTVDIGFALKLTCRTTTEERKRNVNRVFNGPGRRGHVLVVLGYPLSAENGRWEQAKIASLCRVLGLRLRPLGELWVDIDVHGRWVIDGVVLRFLRETVRADTFHCYDPKTQERRNELEHTKGRKDGGGERY